jgi:hypothetical protein
MMSFYNNMDLFREAKEQQSGDKEAYEKFFQATLKKFNADSPQDLDTEKRKEFFDYVNKNWKAQDEAKDLDESKMRSVKVNFTDGSDMTTSVAANMSDKDIKDYYKVGKSFNVGKGDKDKMAKVKSVEIMESTIDEETVHIEYLNKDKGFRKDKKTFTGKDAYEKAEKWAKENLGKFNQDMLKVESVNEELGPMTGKMPDADAQNKDGQRAVDKMFQRWHNAATKVYDHPYGENQDGTDSIEQSAEPQTYAIESIVNKYLKGQD